MGRKTIGAALAAPIDGTYAKSQDYSMRNMDVLIGSRSAWNLPSWMANSLRVKSSVAFLVNLGGTLNVRSPPFLVWTANMLSETYVQSLFS